MDGRCRPNGYCPNPSGRPPSSRTRIADKLIADIYDVWKRRGAEVLERLADEEPATLAQIAFGLVPREVFLQVEASDADSMTPEELSDMLAVIRMMRAKTIEPVTDAEPVAIEEIKKDGENLDANGV